MMADSELAVAFACEAALDWLGADRATREAHWLATHGDPGLAHWLAGIAPTHLYYGSELCEHLLPAERSLRRMLARAERAALRFALLTPVASPDVLRRLAPLLDLLPEGTEVVVNDWGVGHLVRAFPGLRPVAGRLLCRMTKDPRLGGRESAQRCSTGVESEPLQAVFRRLGFSRLEIDVPLLPEPGWFAGLPLPKAVHLPYACVAKGRMCRPGSMSIRGPERFAVGRRCRKECLGLAATTTRPGFRDAVQTVHVGNTLFSRHSDHMLAAVRASIRSGSIERIVVPGEPL